MFENEHGVVFNKPAGLVVIPTPKKEARTLLSVVNQQYRSDQNSFKLHPCHRIDRDTSGLIIFAKGKRHQQLMMDQFKKRKVRKRYTAFVHGALKKKEGEIRSNIRGFEQKRYRRRVPAKSALTCYKVVKTKQHFSVVDVEPVTGRTNQIRIHFSNIGHPLVGERKYAFAKDYNLKFKRAALHAAFLQWKDPVDHKTITVESPLSEDMEKFIKVGS